MKKLKIVDISTLLPGPFTSFLLMKYIPCEVVKIEDKNQPDPLMFMRPTREGVGLGYQGINKDKRILKVDYRKDGKEIVMKEVESADIFIENFKRGKTYKMGLAYEDMQKINPHILYCSISGYNTKSPLANKSAHDLNILALSGYLDQQLKIGISHFLPPLFLADIFTAYHSALMLISQVLQGISPSHLEVAMYDAFKEAMYFSHYPQLEMKTDFSASDYLMSGAYPCYGLYDSKDGRKVAVAAIETTLWIDFCTHLQRPDLMDKQYEKEYTIEVAKELKKYESTYWMNDELDICVTPVISVLEAQNYHYV